ncbi:ribosomal protein S18-alanine N-acetyltransferase [Chitinivorax sp. PXF-14]|uniref:ribosomal protein S18-alanine N-acetyltransferase n=1 Tax=Chitinivorax sp. PXF-14 TaxID=3230488 RepID=UPI003466EEFC
MTLDFRRMSEDDLDRVMAIEQAIYPYPWTRGNFADSLRGEQSCWTAWNPANEMIGYCIIMPVVDEAHLLNISIAKSSQGKGLGRKLLDFAIDTSRAHGASIMLLEVRESNLVAQTLYHSLGFNNSGVRKNYYPVHGGREHAVLMELPL